MVTVIKGVISAGGYKLADIQHKIKKLFLLGDLTEGEMDELLALASRGVSTDAERPETLALIHTLADEIKALEERVTALEGGSEEPTEEYPAWKPWDGISNEYQRGAVVTHNGELWESVFAGQNVWEPGTPGTETMWIKYTKE